MRIPDKPAETCCDRELVDKIKEIAGRLPPGCKKKELLNYKNEYAPYEAELKKRYFDIEMKRLDSLRNHSTYARRFERDEVLNAAYAKYHEYKFINSISNIDFEESFEKLKAQYKKECTDKDIIEAAIRNGLRYAFYDALTELWRNQSPQTEISLDAVADKNEGADIITVQSIKQGDYTDEYDKLIYLGDVAYKLELSLEYIRKYSRTKNVDFRRILAYHCKCLTTHFSEYLPADITDYRKMTTQWQHDTLLTVCNKIESLYTKCFNRQTNYLKDDVAQLLSNTSPPLPEDIFIEEYTVAWVDSLKNRPFCTEAFIKKMTAYVNKHYITEINGGR